MSVALHAHRCQIRHSVISEYYADIANQTYHKHLHDVCPYAHAHIVSNRQAEMFTKAFFECVGGSLTVCANSKFHSCLFYMMIAHPAAPNAVTGEDHQH